MRKFGILFAMVVVAFIIATVDARVGFFIMFGVAMLNAFVNTAVEFVVPNLRVNSLEIGRDVILPIVQEVMAGHAYYTYVCHAVAEALAETEPGLSIGNLNGNLVVYRRSGNPNMFNVPELPTNRSILYRIGPDGKVTVNGR